MSEAHRGYLGTWLAGVSEGLKPGHGASKATTPPVPCSRSWLLCLSSSGTPGAHCSQGSPGQQLCQPRRPLQAGTPQHRAPRWAQRAKAASGEGAALLRGSRALDSIKGNVLAVDSQLEPGLPTRRGVTTLMAASESLQEPSFPHPRGGYCSTSSCLLLPSPTCTPEGVQQSLGFSQRCFPDPQAT